MIRLAVDAIIVRDSKILLIERKNPPHGMALPGGLVEEYESCEEAVARELKEETNLDVLISEQLGTYSRPNRDPRGRTVSVVYMIEAAGDPTAGDDAKDFKWVPIEELTPELLAFDHFDIIQDYINYKIRRGLCLDS